MRTSRSSDRSKFPLKLSRMHMSSSTTRVPRSRRKLHRSLRQHSRPRMKILPKPPLSRMSNSLQKRSWLRSCKLSSPRLHPKMLLLHPHLLHLLILHLLQLQGRPTRATMLSSPKAMLASSSPRTTARAQTTTPRTGTTMPRQQSDAKAFEYVLSFGCLVRPP